MEWRHWCDLKHNLTPATESLASFEICVLPPCFTQAITLYCLNFSSALLFIAHYCAAIAILRSLMAQSLGCSGLKYTVRPQTGFLCKTYHAKWLIAAPLICSFDTIREWFDDYINQKKVVLRSRNTYSPAESFSLSRKILESRMKLAIVKHSKRLRE
ncbi:unnamed protein product [Albugo candida]|uniref:Uncharacterized protein n=1 Tax=Albugo candida TaxID=65357 RepID=A0A024GDC0_9STRA|nr:unnamed protein product [Albugo candida]|eukprot:CCI44518.1 unnamed protein product [Albugo candida]